MLTIPNTNKFGGKRVYNGLWPVDLPKGFPVIVDMTNAAGFPWVIDLSEEQDLAQIPFIQSAWVDNSKNSIAIVITPSIGQAVIIPPNAQGFVPILDTDHRFTVTTLNGTAAQNTQTPIIFLSVPMPATVWDSNSANDLWTPSSAVVGSYQIAMNTGVIAAGTPGGSIFAMRYAPQVQLAVGNNSTIALIRKIEVCLSDIVAFTVGTVIIAPTIARAFTASDTGGTPATLTGNNLKMRTSFPSTNMTDIRVATTTNLTAGTRTLDPSSFAVLMTSVTAVAGQPPNGGNISTVFRANIGEQPLQLANNEGFEILQSVPATGTWQCSVVVGWDEVTGY